MFQKVVHPAVGIENEAPVRATLLLYTAKTLHGVGLLYVARDTFNGRFDERGIDTGDLLRTIRYERAQVDEDLGQYLRALSTEFKKLYAETPQIMRM